MAHVEEKALLEYTLGQLEGEAATSVETHLSSCEECRQRQQNISSAAFSKTAVGSSKDGVPTREDGGGPASNLVLTRGATLGRYVVLEKLGAGGMGEVFAAYDPTLDRKVAIKLLRGGALSAEEGKARLMREAQAMARLQHPNVIAVHDVGLFGERVFVAMEYVDGETLGDWLRAQRRWDEIIKVYLQAADGLAAAHRAGLVHRDFKPDNVLVGHDGRPRVLDFGLARQSTATPSPATKAERELMADSSLAAPLTRDGAVMGTPGYMAPEQIDGLPTDARSDQFSFCVALWEGLYGKRPFAGSTLRQHAQEIAAGRLGPTPADSQVPSWVREVLERGLKANPADRWPEMDALIKALRPRAKRNPRRTLFVVGLVLFSIFGIGYGVWTRQRLLVCGGTEKALLGLWDAPRKAKLRAGFQGTGLSYADEAWTRTERALDTWAAEYALTAREVCEAARLRKVDSPELAELKNACLDERLQELSALVTLFEAPDHDVVNNAPLAARELQRAATCTQAAALTRHLAVDPAEKEAETQLQKKLMEARTLYAAGKYAAGAEKLNEGIPPSAPPTAQAEAYLLLARLEVKRGNPALERNANLNAAVQGLKSGDQALIARGLSRLSLNAALEEENGSLGDAEAWDRLAAAAAARVPGDWEVQVELSRNEGLVDLRRKRYKQALASFERVLELQQKHLGEEHPEVASTLNNLGTTLTYLNRFDEAVTRYDESLRLHEKLEGEDHPNVALALHNLGVALRRMGRFADARAPLERSMRLRKKTLGASHRDTLTVSQSLARLLITLGDLEAAGVLLAELRETRVQLNGAESPELLPVLESETELLLAGEYWREAAERAAMYLALAKAHAEKEVPSALLLQARAWTQLGAWADARKVLGELQRRLAAGEKGLEGAAVAEQLGRLELAQGNLELALPQLRRAVELRGKDVTPSQGPVAGQAELALAQALLLAKQPAEALPFAASAVQRFTEAHAERLLVEAQLIDSQARFLANPDAGVDSATVLVSLMPKLPEPRRVIVADWMKKQGLSLDAGVP